MNHLADLLKYNHPVYINRNKTRFVFGLDIILSIYMLYFVICYDLLQCHCNTTLTKGNFFLHIFIFIHPYELLALQKNKNKNKKLITIENTNKTPIYITSRDLGHYITWLVALMHFSGQTGVSRTITMIKHLLHFK